MARFEAPQADIYPRTPDPQVLGIDLLSLVLGKNPLLPTSTTDNIPNDIPVTTTAVTKFPGKPYCSVWAFSLRLASTAVITTVITTGNDGQPTTVIRTTTQTTILPTTTNGDDHTNNPAVPTNTALKHGTTTPPGSNINGGIGTSGSQNPSDVVAGGRSTVTVLSESPIGEAMKAVSGLLVILTRRHNILGSPSLFQRDVHPSAACNSERRVQELVLLDYLLLVVLLMMDLITVIRVRIWPL
jgi:hypothetical protein